jgi:hypothetical protein
VNTHLRAIPLAFLLTALLAACDLPFGLGLPSTRALEAGARASLASSALELSGTYQDAGSRWSIDVQLARPDREHVTVTGATLKLEAIVIGGQGYFRGQDFLAAHSGSDPLSQSLVRAAGNAWWKGAAGLVPAMSELTDADAFQRTFLGASVSRRTDHVTVDGVDAVDLSGARADVFIDVAPPYRLLRVSFAAGTSIDGLRLADLHYGGFGKDFKIAVPQDVIDFSNLSTLPPIYQVESVDTSRCATPCLVSALLRNLGGLSGASAPSTVTFTMTSTGGDLLGRCQADVTPDVGSNDTTTVSCTITNVSVTFNAAIVTASVDNPGRG